MKNLFLVVFSCVLTVKVFAQISPEVQKLQYYGYFNKAKLSLQKGIQGNPMNIDNYYELGVIYNRTNNQDSAKIVFTKLVELYPKSPLSTVAQGFMSLNSGNKDEAKAFFERAAKSTKFKDGMILRKIGEAYLYSPKKDLTNAVEYLKKAVAIEIKNPVSYYSLGEAYYLLNEAGSAVTQYEFCTDYDKSAAWAYTRIGQIFKGAKNYQKADEAFKLAFAADADYPYIYKELAEWKYLYQDYPEAVKNFDKYQQLTGDNGIEAKTLRSTYTFYNKSYKETINLVNEIMKVDSSKNYMVRLLGYSSFEQGDSLAAKNYMEKFFQKAPKEKIIWSDYFYLGKVYNKFGSDSLATLQYKKAIELDSTKIDIYNDLAKMNFARGNFKNAGYWYGKKLEKLEKFKLQDYFDPAFAYFKAEDYNNANIYFDKIVKKYPTSVVGQLYYARSNAYLDPQSLKALAKPNYEKVIELGEVDPVKYKNELKEAYKYMYYFFYNSQDKATALTIADKLVKIDPNDPEGLQMLEAAK
ncbi:MAG: tetratricopeptide repeat protein [Saprospiraceae bacterium]|nr:tetratricopeptide repeat protein [Saprospiraceae bacterium]